MILRHLPEDSAFAAHFDLLVEPAHPAVDGARDIPTWRCDRRPDRLEIGQDAVVEDIAPHRRWWLEQAVGEVVTLRPPLGTARVIARGVLMIDGPGDSSAGSALRIQWADDSGVAEYRIEGSRLDRRAPSPHGEGPCCPGAGSCC